MRVAFAVFLAVFAALAHAERATERYAPAQLGVAHALLDQARAAASLEQFSEAGKLAWQALVDARIAYGMTDAATLRAEAAQLAAQASALTGELAAHSAAARAQPRIGTFSPSASLR